MVSTYHIQMPQKLTAEIIYAAIEGFESQKRRIDAQIDELRQLLKATARPKLGYSTSTIQAEDERLCPEEDRRRSKGKVGQGQSRGHRPTAIEAEAEVECCRSEGNQRSCQATLGC
jgi:hypothetical protein